MGDQPASSCLRVQEVPDSKERRGGRRKGRDWRLGPLSLSCRPGPWGRSQGRVSAEHSSVPQVCPFKVTGSPDWSAAGQGVLSHCNWSWPCPPGSAAFLGLELNHPWGLDVDSREGRGSGRGHPWGEVPVFPSLPCRAFLLPWGPSAPGCQSLGQCVQRSVPIFLFRLPRNFPSFSLSCLTGPSSSPWNRVADPWRQDCGPSH